VSVDYLGDTLPARDAIDENPITPPVIKEKIQAAADTDTSTRQTIEKMAEYARAGAADPVVKHWSNYAIAKFGNAPFRSESLKHCFADFFCLKHCVHFVNDEPRLFQVGEPEALDLLIAPAVLVRMEQPAEDCDGFAMLTCSLLQIQGIKCYFVTIACDPSDQSRWSHVFAMAELPDGTRLPLDASKGKVPGWMVPRAHIFRWQAWDMDGKPVDVGPPVKNTLHGYTKRKMRGVGDGEDLMPGEGPPPDTSTVVLPFFGNPTLPQITSQSPLTPATLQAQNPGLTADQIAKIISASTSGALNIFKQTQSPGLVPGTNLVFDPGSNRFLPASGYGSSVSSIFGSASSTIPSWLPMAGLALVAIFVLPSLLGGKR